jgi:hypothetical protein
MTEQKTRASVAPPPKKGSTFLPQTMAPTKVDAADNMKTKTHIGMTFNMPQDWHHEFKMAATINRVSMHELLAACFEAWKREQKAK